MDLFHATVLGLVQGLTEFLPISSAGHLILFSQVMGWDDQGLAFDLAVHLGTLLAVVIYFRIEIIHMIRAFFHSFSQIRAEQKFSFESFTADGRLAWGVILGTIPVGICGILFKDYVSEDLRSAAVIGLALIFFGIILGWIDLKGKKERDETTLSLKDILIIGCAQALALIPGTSRSGITMTAALFLGINREGASRFSFLLSIPVTFLAGSLEMIELIQSHEAIDWPGLLLGTVVAGTSAYLCIHYFLAFIRKIGMMPFVVYRIAIGIILLYFFL